MNAKTSELTGPALDWAVAKCAGVQWWAAEEARDGLFLDYERTLRYSPSTNWSQGGPIIEREGIGIAHAENGTDWVAMRRYTFQRDDAYWDGPTPLIAALRCFVASELGDEVDVPEEPQPQPQPTQG